MTDCTAAHVGTTALIDCNVNAGCNGAGGASGTGGASDGLLQTLYVTGYSVPATTLSLAARITSLTSLHVSNFLSRESMSALFDAACESGLPHLQTICFPVVISGPNNRAYLLEEDDGFNPSCLHFLQQFATRLRHIDLHRCELHCEASQQLITHLLACTGLQTLTLRDGLEQWSMSSSSMCDLWNG